MSGAGQRAIAPARQASGVTHQADDVALATLTRRPRSLAHSGGNDARMLEALCTGDSILAWVPLMSATS